MTREGCPSCEMIQKGNVSNIILENEKALAVATDSYREGQCLVFVKRHIQTISDMEPEEYNAAFELVTKVSKALEEKYSARKTYLLAIGDGNIYQHVHFHLIPKHRDLPSMGVYCFQKLWEAEPPREPSEARQKALADELKGLVQAQKQ